jgi:hypothetical protein
MDARSVLWLKLQPLLSARMYPGALEYPLSYGSLCLRSYHPVNILTLLGGDSSTVIAVLNVRGGSGYWVMRGSCLGLCVC